MPRWIRSILDCLLALYCIYGAKWINDHFFNGGLDKIRFALIVTALFISGYPIWGWKSTSPWSFIGRWTYLKWVAAGILCGIFMILVQVFAEIVVNYYSS